MQHKFNILKLVCIVVVHSTIKTNAKAVLNLNFLKFVIFLLFFCIYIFFILLKPNNKLSFCLLLTKFIQTVKIFFKGDVYGRAFSAIKKF